jgi:hypothetical protein
MTAAVLEVNGTDRTPVSQWDATWEERVDGVGQASVTIQDRDPSSTLEYGRGNYIVTPGHSTLGWRDILKMSVGATNLFWGEIDHATLNLPVGFPWRRWKIGASDFNTVMDLRYVGMPDGFSWQTIDGGRTHEAYDPNAHGQSRDGATVQALFDAYVELPALVGPTTFDTTSFVHNWLPASVMVDPSTGESRLHWDKTPLRSATDEIRGMANFPIFCWIDPDLAVHWEAFKNWDFIEGGGLTLLSPTTAFQRIAPAIVTDTDPDGVTSVGGRDLRIEYDGTYMPQQVYVSGVTDYIYNGGDTIFQGTGWGRPHGDANSRHGVLRARKTLVDAEAVTDIQKGAIAGSYTNYGRRARIRGSVKVGQPGEAVDGWRCGQLLSLFDSRLPPSLYGRAFPIQRVAGSLKAGQEFREYTLEFGDFPIARFSQKYRTTPQRLPTARLPAKQHVITWPTQHLRPSTAYVLTSQMVDRSGKPVRHGGVSVSWSMAVTNAAGATVSTGSIAPITSVTDAHGRTAATLTTGSATGLHYRVHCATAAQV